MSERGAVSDYAQLAARVLLCALFLLSGIEKLFSYQATAGFMQANAVPSVFLPLVIFVETVGGFAVLLGYKTRVFALALAAFCILTALIFHNELSNKVHFVLFWSDLAIAGGFLLLFANGPGRFSLDQRQ